MTFKCRAPLEALAALLQSTPSFLRVNSMLGHAECIHTVNRVFHKVSIFFIHAFDFTIFGFSDLV